tara:strand:- start:628 stop:966 length:339 start_codon:yes stop_codon:yes gene_type:complete
LTSLSDHNGCAASTTKFSSEERRGDTSETRADCSTDSFRECYQLDSNVATRDKHPHTEEEKKSSRGEEEAEATIVRSIDGRWVRNARDVTVTDEYRQCCESKLLSPSGAEFE